MAQWYVKDLSKLTGVSVQTLHHYDRISLLKPSLRLSNRYRLYSEKDLLKLQQIVALKYFGFELTQIKKLLSGNVAIEEHFSAQARFLAEKADALREASQTLKSILAECSQDKSIPWESIIKLIEVYRMTQQLEKTWAGKVFTPEELKQYARFEAELKTRFTAEEKKAFEDAWEGLVAKIHGNLNKSPESKFGIDIAKQVMDLINGLYGKENANLKNSIWEKGFKKGLMEGDQFLEPEIVSWLDKAIDAYYQGRIYSLLDQVGTHNTQSLIDQWESLMGEMFGDSQHLNHLKKEVIDNVMVDEKVSVAARKWLQQFVVK